MFKILFTSSPNDTTASHPFQFLNAQNGLKVTYTTKLEKFEAALGTGEYKMVILGKMLPAEEAKFLKVLKEKGNGIDIIDVSGNQITLTDRPKNMVTSTNSQLLLLTLETRKRLENLAK